MSRRCTQRQFLMRPDKHVEQIFLYCLGEAAERFDVTLHAWVAMSNHQHLIIRDNKGNYPAFLAHLNKMLAKVLNAHWGRWENLWATEQPNAVYLVEASDRFNKLVYLLANPVAADLVDRVTDWPGASSFSLNLSGRSKTVARPKLFFRNEGRRMPEMVTLRAERLDGFEELSDAEWSKRIAAAVQEAERKARLARREGGTGVLGRKAVLRSLPDARPATGAPRRGLRPVVACRNVKLRRVVLEALRAFRVAHRSCLLRFVGGERNVVFPAGTYRMPLLGARCDDPVPDALVACV